MTEEKEDEGVEIDDRKFLEMGVIPLGDTKLERIHLLLRYNLFSPILPIPRGVFFVKMSHHGPLGHPNRRNFFFLGDPLGHSNKWNIPFKKYK